MANEEFTEKFMEIVGVANPHHLKRALRMADTHSSYVRCQKILNGLKDLGQLERANGVYRSPSCKSEGGEHSLAETQIIAEIFYHFDNPQIYRERLIEEKSIRPDIMTFVKKDGRGLVMIVEVVLQESENYLEMKRNIWLETIWACQYLSKIFNTTIKHFDFLTHDQLTTYLEEIKA